MAEDYRMTAVDEKGRRIYTDTGEYIPLWKREGRTTPNAQAKKPSGGGAGAGLAGLAATVGGKYLAHKIPGWVAGASTPASTGSFFGSAGTGFAEASSVLDAAAAGAPTAEAGIFTGGGVGGGAGGGAASAGGAPAGLSSVASYAVPAAIALAGAYNLHKLTGGGKDSDREAGRWRDAGAQGYKYGPDSFDTVADPTAGELADKSGIAALLLGNAWRENFTPEERTSIMGKVLADPGSRFNERLGGYEYDKGALARAAQEIATAKGQGDWAMGRYNEQKKRDDRDTQLLLGRGPNKIPGERNPNMRDFARGPYRDYLSANWMPEQAVDPLGGLSESALQAALDKLRGQG